MRQRHIGDGRTTLTVSEICLGTMLFGYRTDERTSFAILDRFLEAGGTFLDTANNYGQWHGDAGESERVLGRWMRSRGVTDRMVIASKVGARTLKPGDPSPEHWQGLGAAHVREDLATSLRQLGKERIDLFYAHIDHRETPLAETVDALASVAESGDVGLLGCSNTTLWRMERARALAGDRPTYSCLQQQHTYLLPLPTPRQSNLITEETLDYAATEGIHLFAYSPLMQGYYARGGQPRPEYAHAANTERLRVLGEVADEVGATRNQVVLAWLLASEPKVIPIPGASSVEQLDEILGALKLDLSPEIMARLDEAGRTAPTP
ncbi:oxidoreductase [Virgisporangium aliadipatigenens]|uniref:Oxidoreductase n=1 Tax=Virgisporangium aliadipatigenens TaxID=741659 RepID=A0A8J3YMV4_9ACTN|nr:aldo/keto reductase [Virgisporangium aliadipatigenens]GIJ46770.1 oxidoreductase [Virgisporangium aliadipatigenens]